jgi:NAD(P)-dependent dehydrogenase (short-subunit alcohol dehydrogenase family)
VVAADFDEAGGWQTDASIFAGGGEALFVRADVSQAPDVKAVMDRTIQAFGRWDAAHNNADRVLAEHPELGQALLATEPIGRFGEPEEIAEAVVWQCSETASFDMGAGFPFDGAQLARS